MRCRALALLLVFGMAVPPSLLADSCTVAAGFTATPLPNFGVNEKYLNQYPGLLYDGSNDVPAAHDADGRTLAATIKPVDRNTGRPCAAGTHNADCKVVFLSIGFSNNTIEFCGGSTFLDNGRGDDDPAATGCPTPIPLQNTTCTVGTNCPYNQDISFMGQAFTDTTGTIRKNGDIVLVDGAKGGQVLACWDDTGYDPQPQCDSNPDNYGRVKNILEGAGFEENQVLSIWLKDSNDHPIHSLSERGTVLDSQIDAFKAEKHFGNVLRSIQTHYPNIRQVFISPRIYGGFATTVGNTLNPDPFAYELGFSIKFLIQAQITQLGGGGTSPIAGDLFYNVSNPSASSAPWIAWGPYLWADGSQTCPTGQVCLNSDFRYTWPDNPDGSKGNECTHPGNDAEQKVGKMLLDYMKASPYTAWFRP